MTRRDFTCAGAFAALTCLAPKADPETFDYPWKLGIITDEVDADLSHVLNSFYPKYQLHWAEIRNLKLNGASVYAYRKATPDQLKQARKQMDDAGVKLSVLDTAVYKILLPGTTAIALDPNDLHRPQGEYDRQMDDLKRASDAAHILGTDRLRIFAFLRVSDPSSVFNRVVDELNKALAVAKQQGATLLLENEFSTNIATGAESGKLLQTISDRRLMLNWDPGNCIEAGENPFPKGWEQFDHSRIGHIHLKDEAGKKWKPIGAGEIDFASQFKALKEMQYSSTLSLETHYRNAAKDPYTSSVESMDGLVRVLKQV